MHTQATAFLREDKGGRVTGVRYRTSHGTTGELRATLTVACDGRHSIARTLPELRLRDFPAPMHACWFRLLRHPGDPEGVAARTPTAGLCS